MRYYRKAISICFLVALIYATECAKSRSTSTYTNDTDAGCTPNGNESCDFTNDKNEHSGNSSGDEPCFLVSEESIGWTEESELGITPQSLFEKVEGECEASFSWNAMGWDEYFIAHPQSGDTNIKVAIEIDKQSAAFVTRRTNESIGGIKPPCSPILEVPAQVYLETEDGAFRESRAVSVDFSIDDFPVSFDNIDINTIVEQGWQPSVEFSISIPTERLGGSFAIEAMENVTITLYVVIMPIKRECAGRISFFVERKINDHEGEIPGGGDLATWSSTN